MLKPFNQYIVCDKVLGMPHGAQVENLGRVR